MLQFVIWLRVSKPCTYFAVDVMESEKTEKCCFRANITALFAGFYRLT